MISVHDRIKRRDASKLKLSEKTKDSTDPLCIMSKPEIELDWSQTEKLKKEKMEKINTAFINEEKIIESTKQNETLQQQNILSGIKIESNEQNSCYGQIWDIITSKEYC